MEGVWIFIGCNGSRSMALRSIYVQQQGLVVGNIMLKRLDLLDRVLTECSPLCPCPYSCPWPHVGQGPCSAAYFPRAATYQASSLQIFSVFFVTLFIKKSRKSRKNIFSVFLITLSLSTSSPDSAMLAFWKSVMRPFHKCQPLSIFEIEDSWSCVTRDTFNFWNFQT